MPSPFPGMDPYLEAPDIWPDFHDAFAGEIRALLNQALPAPYYARLEMRPEIGIVEAGDNPRRIVPDIAVVRHPAGPRADGRVAVADLPRAAISPHVEVQLFSEPLRHAFVEIRDPARGHRLVTLLEIASPSNKYLGPDREAYQRKQREVLASDANLIELDLLRAGKRLFAFAEIEAAMAQHDPPADYVAVISRAWQRGANGQPRFVLHAAAVTQRLPCIGVPLRAEEPEVPLDLQFAFQRAYDSGPYRRGAVDYTAPPRPPLAEALVAWADDCLRACGLR
jgi:hypothetical protein